jgi:signal transduction histidine kinase
MIDDSRQTLQSPPLDGEERVRILLVDDNPANLLALESVLDPLGQELVMARSGGEALELLKKQDCALVLMDVHMPVLDGFQTVEAIRQRHQLAHLPVMFLTAMFKDQQSAARGYALGAVDFIMKPFEPAFIRAKVGAFVSLYQYNERLKRHQQLLADEVAARKAAEQANRAKEEFIAVLGHDLRTPLNAIMLTAESHERQPQALEPCRVAGRRISTSASRMSRLIADVVDFTRSRLGGGIPIKREAANMAELCRAPLDEIRAIHPDSDISVHADGDVHGEWDPERVLQVVANLVGNAATHGNGKVRVSIRGAPEHVVLEVHNDGLPIPSQKMEHLFEPFYPGGRRREGLGLGLYIIDQIVRAHGGSIRAESTATAGTTFTVYWPRHPRGASARSP